MREPLHLGISLGNQHSFVDGLGEFSRQLCTRFAAQAAALRERHGWIFHVYLPEEQHGVFGPELRYIAPRRLHRSWHTEPERFALWHTVQQLNRYRPPRGTGHRILTVHDLNFFYFKNAYSQRRDAWQLRRLLRRTDTLVTISAYVGDDLRQRMGWRGPIEVVHNGARDLGETSPEPVPGVEPGRYLFHLSRMAASKNVGALIEMAAIWPEQPVVLAGPDGPALRAVREQVRARGLSHVQVFASITDGQKAWLYENCAGFMLPSLTEGFGLPVIEAMHFGRPTFLSDRTCLPEIGGRWAWYWHDFEPHSMRRVVEQGLAQWRAENLADAIRAHAAQFTWDRCAEHYLSLYARVLGGGSPT